MAASTEQNLRLFRELISCMRELYFWTYDPEMKPTYTNCPEPETAELLFETISDAVPRDAVNPALITSELGLSWVTECETDAEGNVLRIYAIGPALISQISMDLVRKAVTEKHGVSYTMINRVEKMVSRIPTVPISRLVEYSLMLHYCLKEEKITYDDVIFPETLSGDIKGGSGHTENPFPTWLMEQELFKLVEEGNLNFKEVTSRLVSGAVPADLGSGDFIRHHKNLMIVFIAGCARAAIRGGLSPETSYLLSDRYIQDLEKCRTMREIIELNSIVQEDYTLRVHRIKAGTMSPQIQRACEYIQIHVEDELSLSSVSSAVGYSPSWLSGKFRRETGKTLTDYITETKVERAKMLLRAGNDPVQDIAERLSYRTASRFGSVFRKYTGMSPGEYRRSAGAKKP